MHISKMCSSHIHYQRISVTVMIIIMVTYKIIRNPSRQYARVATQFYKVCLKRSGAHGGLVVEALCHNLEGHGFDSGWCHWIFSLK
jgi:hypothetical protein